MSVEKTKNYLIGIAINDNEIFLQIFKLLLCSIACVSCQDFSKKELAENNYSYKHLDMCK